MSMNPLPPQAYTKDTLVKAFQWIQLQPDNIKDLASTPDVLVSLYLKAKLQGDAALERPSIQNFKSELKNLAGQLGEFDTSKDPSFGINLNSGPNHSGQYPFEGRNFSEFQGSDSKGSDSKASDSKGTDSKVDPRNFETKPKETRVSSYTSNAFAPNAFATNSNSNSISGSNAPLGTSTGASPTSASVMAPHSQKNFNIGSSGSVSELDSKSSFLVQETRQICNLQSDADALRLLISIGHSQLKNLLR